MTEPTKALTLEEKRERVRQLLAKKNAAPRSHPLSFAQQRLWFLEQLAPGSAHYTIPAAVRLRGTLHEEALGRALEAIVHRHEVLRTTFLAVDGEPAPQVRPPAPLALPREDLSALSGAGQQEAWERLVREESSRGFHLDREPPLRVRLLRLSGQEHVLLITAHHITWDAWSSGVFLRELSALYNAFAQGQPSPLAPLASQYGDWAAWQRQWLQGEVLEQQLTWWRRHLAGAPHAVDLPLDHPRPAMQTHAGALCVSGLGPALSRRVRALGQRAGATPFMVLLAAFQVLLQRYSHQDTFVVGTPIANRHHARSEPLIGFFVNTLALRADLTGDPSFEALLGRVREAALGAFAHQDLPFERLVEALQVDRDLSRSPLFNVMFAVPNAPLGGVALHGLEAQVLELDAPVAKFELTLTVREVGEQFEAHFEYNTDLFAPARIERMARHLRVLLEDLTAHPERRVSELHLLSEDERHQVLWDWNHREAPLPARTTLGALVEAQVARTPDAEAVRAGTTSLTYRELDARADAIARWLGSLGLGREALVAVALPRGLEWAAAVLGATRAGTAFLPLDITLPRPRLARLLEDARPGALLSLTALVPALPEVPGARVLRLDAPPPLPPSDARPAVEPDQLAYVIHTSGSTGMPKGVMISHEGICHRLLWEQRARPLGPGDRVPQVASHAFDASLWEFFRPLIAGACCVIAAEDEAKDAHRLSALLTRERITEAAFVPSLLEALLDEPDFGASGVLGRVVCAGEALRGSLQERFFARLPAAQLENFYGQTEVSIDALSFECQRGVAPRVVPIGRPLADMRAYVLDARLAPLPLGIWGELYLEGPGLARGYQRQPGLTATKFLPSPFAEGARLFRTGDVARLREDGALEFRGRTDHQVKVRGVRVELGEIEAVLKQHPRVREAVVLSARELPGLGASEELEHLLSELEREAPSDSRP